MGIKLIILYSIVYLLHLFSGYIIDLYPVFAWPLILYDILYTVQSRSRFKHELGHCFCMAFCVARIYIINFQMIIRKQRDSMHDVAIITFLK